MAASAYRHAVTRLRLPRYCCCGAAVRYPGEQPVSVVALQDDPRPARRNPKSGIPRRQPRLHLRRPVEPPLQLGQVLRVQIRAIVLLPHSVVIVDD